MSVIKGLTYAIIPARSGSTTIKDKNIQHLAGHPMMAYSIAAAILTPEITRVIVSTDSEQYASIAKQYGAEIPFLRPASISGPYSTDYEFMEHAIKWLDKHNESLPEYWVHLRPTTPLRNPKLISNALATIKNDESSTSLRSLHKTNMCPFKWFTKDKGGYLETIRDDMSIDQANGPRQLFPQVYIPNGYVDILKTENILNNHNLHGDKSIGFEVPEVIDVDYIEEMEELQNIIRNYSGDVIEWLNCRTNYV